MKRAAFTLMEVVMVAALLSILVGAVFEAVRAERRAVRRIRTRLDLAAHARAAHQALARGLEGAPPRHPRGVAPAAPAGPAPSVGGGRGRAPLHLEPGVTLPGGGAG